MADEFYCDAPELRSFIGKVKETVAGTATVKAKLAAIRPPFAQLMANPHWLPEDFRRPLAEGGMGKGIANWLLYRDAEGVLTLTALVLPPGVTTPVHDHLAWGLVGLYAGEQEEEVYAPAAPVGPDDKHAELRLTARQHLGAGSFYELIPPTGDIHRVTAAGEKPSISLHLLAGDVGCALRHRLEPETGEVAPFRSGYSNRSCEVDGESKTR